MTDFLCSSTSHLQFYATATYPCSYLAHQEAKSLVAAPSEAIDTEQYSALIQHGFRRSGAFVYRPHCDQCRACQSVRIPVQDFRPNRSQKRAGKQHADLTAHISQPVFSPEHYALYARYQKARHAGGGMDVDDPQQYTDFLVTSHVETMMVEFRRHRPGDPLGELKMVSIIDKIDGALSAVYTFYEPEPGQNFGTFNVLWQIQWAKNMGLTHVYLGYWIEACAKMAYKSRFVPHELLVSGRWQISQ